jgi:hypothetical protein
MSLQTYSTFEEYQKAFFPKEKGALTYSKPEEFGHALAQRHIEIVRGVVQEWLKESATTTKAPSTETKQDQGTDTAKD